MYTVFKNTLMIIFYFRDGRLKVHDELLMANGRSLIGLTHKEAVAVLKSMPATVQLVVATEVMIIATVLNELLLIYYIFICSHCTLLDRLLCAVLVFHCPPYKRGTLVTLSHH